MSENICKKLWSRLRELYGEKAFLHERDQDSLRKTNKCFFWKESQYANLLQRLEDTGTVKRFSKRLTEISVLFWVSKERMNKPAPHPRARRADCHFIDPEYLYLLHLGLFMQHENPRKKDIYVVELNAENFYHRRHVSRHLQTLF